MKKSLRQDKWIYVSLKASLVDQMLAKNDENKTSDSKRNTFSKKQKTRSDAIFDQRALNWHQQT